MTKNKILVTGGAGFIGSHIVDELISRGHDVRILDNFEPQVHKNIPEYLNKEAELIVGDVRDEEIVKKALEDVDIIFHKAAAVGVGQSLYQIKKYVDVNTFATAKILDILANGNYPIKKFIVASSMSIYGEGAYSCEKCGEAKYPELRREEQMQARDWKLKCADCGSELIAIPTPETKPLQPTSIYAISKKDQEEMSLTVGRAYGIPTVALRYFNATGPRQSLDNPYTGVCAIFSSRILSGKSPHVYEDGRQTRDFISVHDVVQANILAMEKNSANYEVFNVGTGTGIAIEDVALELAKAAGSEVKPNVNNKYRPGDTRHCYADLTKSRKLLGFNPKYTTQEAIAEYVKWSMNTEFTDQTDKAIAEIESKGLIK